MPEFLDLLTEELRLKRKEIERVSGALLESSAEYSKMVGEKWNNLPLPGELAGKAFAVDSSSGLVELRGGGCPAISQEPGACA